MRIATVLGVAIACALAIAIGCVSFGLDSRRFRCDGQDERCDPGAVCGVDGYCVVLDTTNDAMALVDATPNDGATGEICGNNIDDDGDGAVDCADSECPGTNTCGPGCMCIDGVPRELACGDGIDNDNRDGIDCNDPDCPRCPNQLTCCPDGRCAQSC
jgi:hypothetical protein